MGGSLFCTFFKKVEKSCPKCFKKRFKSRSRWRLILGLNPSFGGFFSQNFQKLKITKFKTPGRKRTRVHVRSHPQKSIIFGRRRREGGREEDLGFHSTLQKRCASRNNVTCQECVFETFCEQQRLCIIAPKGFLWRANKSMFVRPSLSLSEISKFLARIFKFVPIVAK